MRTSSAVVLMMTISSMAQDVPWRHRFSSGGRLSAASAEPPRDIAARFIQEDAGQQGRRAADIAGLVVVKEYRTAHNGVTHLVYRQRFQDVDVHGSDYTVNIDRDGRVINAGGWIAPAPADGVTAADLSTGAAAVEAAFRHVRGREGTGFSLLPGGSSKTARFARAAFAEQIDGEPVWYPAAAGLRPAWTVYIAGDNGTDNFATVIDAATGAVLASQNLTWYQPAKGLVFERHSPQPNPHPGLLLTAAPPYVERTSQPFDGDPVASPKGWVSDTETKGNNVVAGENLPGVNFLSPAVPASSAGRDFSFPLQLGPGAPNPVQFREAAITNLFYWANRAHDLFYLSGFDEQAGNYQQDNLGRGGTGGDPMTAYSHFGAAANSSAALNNAFYTSSRTGDDGARASINMYIGGSAQDRVFSDGSYDNEVIVHEYTHGVSTRLVRNLGSFQGGAMGEAWSDFFGLEFTVPEGAPPDGGYPQGEYLFQAFGQGIRTRPYSTDMSINPLTYAALAHVTSSPEVHADGEIWVEALWEMRANLIAQLGEAEGRRRVRLLVIDGMKLSPPAPSMVDMRDAILLADQVDFQGASQDQIWTAFAKRGLGALAHSNGPAAVHVLASFDKPSPLASMKLYESKYVLGETVRLVLQDANNTGDSVAVEVRTSSGDFENVILRRAGNYFTASLPVSTSGSVAQGNSVLEVVANDDITAYYVDPDTGSGQPRQITATAATTPAYTVLVSSQSGPPAGGTETPLFPSFGSASVGFSVRTTLPFTFPFFGERYNTARIYSDGLIRFDLPFDQFSSQSCSDASTFSRITGIAPMWMTQAISGTAQSGENIYVTTRSGSVTYRWAGETYPLNSSIVPLRPDPINYSVTLYSDGRIQFDYGSTGNVNLVNSGLLCGINAGGPIVGLSNGHGTYTQRISPWDGSPTLQGARSVVFNPPFGFSSLPDARLESPAAGDHVKGVLNVHGVAWDASSFITRIDILIDGVARRATSVNASRPDFCQAQQVPNCPFIGFDVNLDIGALGLQPGPHTISARATSGRGGIADFPADPVPFTVDEGQALLPVGVLETDLSSRTLSGTAALAGYAYAVGLRVQAVDVLVDGVTYGPALYGLRRSDVCDPLPDPKPLNCPSVGFTFTLNTVSGSVQLPNGPHSLQLRIRDELNRYTLFPDTPVSIEVRNPQFAAPLGVLTAPSPGDTLSGTVRVSGYAWSPDGTVRSVTLMVDGSSYIALPYGTPRPQECATLPGVKACPNIGFDGTFDTRQVSNGVHAFGVRILDSNGNSTVVPSLIRFGMNVTVRN